MVDQSLKDRAVGGSFNKIYNTYIHIHITILKKQKHAPACRHHGRQQPILVVPLPAAAVLHREQDGLLGVRVEGRGGGGGGRVLRQMLGAEVGGVPVGGGAAAGGVGILGEGPVGPCCVWYVRCGRCPGCFCLVVSLGQHRARAPRVVCWCTHTITQATHRVRVMPAAPPACAPPMLRLCESERCIRSPCRSRSWWCCFCFF